MSDAFSSGPPGRGDDDGDRDALALVVRIINGLVDSGLMAVDGDGARRLSGDSCPNHYGVSPGCPKCDAMMTKAAAELARQLGPDLGET